MASTLLLSACEQGGTNTRTGRQATEGPTRRDTEAVTRASNIYAAVIRKLLKENRGFDHLYVVNGSVGDASKISITLGHPDKPFPEELEQALMRKLDDLPPLDFISHPDEALQAGAEKVKDDGVIISLTSIERHGQKAHVGSSLWCGGLCAVGQTYVLESEDGAWSVVGDTGKMVIS